VFCGTAIFKYEVCSKTFNMDEKISRKLAINAGGAIGDLVLCSSLLPPLKEEGHEIGIVSRGFTLPLCKNLPYESTFKSEEETISGDWGKVSLENFLVLCLIKGIYLLNLLKKKIQGKGIFVNGWVGNFPVRQAFIFYL